MEKVFKEQAFFEKSGLRFPEEEWDDEWYFCIDMPDGVWRINTKEIREPLHILAILDHIAEKEWCSGNLVREVIYKLNQCKGFRKPYPLKWREHYRRDAR